MMRRPLRARLVTVAIATLLLGLGTAPWSQASHEGPGTAHISGEFGESGDCTDFDAESDKDISHVVIHYADGESVKHDGLRGKTFSHEGNREIDSVDVKSGRTTETFTCTPRCVPTEANNQCTPCPNGDPNGDGTCGGGGAEFCRALIAQQTLLPIPDENGLSLFVANPEGAPCESDDASVINTDQLRVIRSETDESGTADAELIGLGGPDDPGQISVCGAHADADGEEDAYLVLITAGGEEQLRIGADELPDLAQDPATGIFFAETGDDTAQVAVLRNDGEDLIVLCEAEAR